MFVYQQLAYLWVAKMNLCSISDVLTFPSVNVLHTVSHGYQPGTTTVLLVCEIQCCVFAYHAATKCVQPLDHLIMVYDSVHAVHEQHDLTQSCNRHKRGARIKLSAAPFTPPPLSF